MSVPAITQGLTCKPWVISGDVFLLYNDNDYLSNCPKPSMLCRRLRGIRLKGRYIFICTEYPGPQPISVLEQYRVCKPSLSPAVSPFLSACVLWAGERQGSGSEQNRTGQLLLESCFSVTEGADHPTVPLPACPGNPSRAPLHPSLATVATVCACLPFKASQDPLLSSLSLSTERLPCHLA